MQVPVEQDSLEAQVVPQTLQFEMVRSDASQPFAGLVSQLPHSGSVQEAVQPLVPQPAVPCALVHVSPHWVQLAVVPLGVSQPSAAVQLRKPALHACTQAYVEHEPVAFARSSQRPPQAPQFVFELSCVSQPFVLSPSQSPKCVEQLS